MGTLMPPSPMTGMMKWTGNGSHHKSITQNTRVNGNQNKLTTQTIREHGYTQKSITQNTKNKSLYSYDSFCGIGFDLWQVKSGTIFDNVLITDDIEAAKAQGEELWKATSEAEKKMKEAQDEEEKKKADEEAKNSEPEDDEDDEEFDDADEAHDEL